MHRDASSALPAHGVEMRGLQIGRQRRRSPARRIAAAESLPGEIIVRQRKAAGQPLEPLAQNVRHAALMSPASASYCAGGMPRP